MGISLNLGFFVESSGFVLRLRKEKKGFFRLSFDCFRSCGITTPQIGLYKWSPGKEFNVFKKVKIDYKIDIFIFPKCF